MNSQVMDWTVPAITLGAIAGALSRYYISLFWARKLGSQFPYGTLFVNLTGALLIGVVATLATVYPLPSGLQTLIVVGFLGSYTTFSSYILDSKILFRSFRPFLAAVYWFGSPILGLFSLEIGIWLGHRLV